MLLKCYLNSAIDVICAYTYCLILIAYRQVLSLMVESLTQFFEENGLSSNTPHAVLDDQIYSKNDIYLLNKCMHQDFSRCH